MKDMVRREGVADRFEIASAATRSTRRHSVC